VNAAVAQWGGHLVRPCITFTPIAEQQAIAEHDRRYFLDDAPAEERRTLAVMNRRFLDAETAADLGRLDLAAIERVREEAWPQAENADELHDALMQLGFMTEHEGQKNNWQVLFDELVSDRRASVLRPELDPVAAAPASVPDLWIAAERLTQLRAIYPAALLTPSIAPPGSNAGEAWTFDDALVEILRGRLDGLGPVTVAGLAASSSLQVNQIEAALIRLESEGFVMQGTFTPECRETEWCSRRLLARIHRYTLNRLRKEIERLKQETERLRRELEAALRASKRQAAPHSRGTPKANPQRPGRKPGRRYGRQACRPIPARVDERVTVPLPECCPHCGGGVEPESCETQYQEEIVRRTIVRRFDIAVGHCCDCRRRVQGRHPLQTSDAVGVGNVQLGPETLTLAAILNKQMGLSLGHTRQVLSYGFGLEVSRGGLYRALARMASRAGLTYDGLVETARQAPVNGMDETGWRVGGRLQWLHVAVSAQVTVYAILPGRGYEQSKLIVGAAYDGFLLHDGWAPYYRFQFAFHQSCLAHLLHRCREMMHIASPAALAFPRAVEDLLQTGLELRNRYERGEVCERGLGIATGKLEAKLDRMLETRRRNPANRRCYCRTAQISRIYILQICNCHD
jgi:transposase